MSCCNCKCSKSLSIGTWINGSGFNGFDNQSRLVVEAVGLDWIIFRSKENGRVYAETNITKKYYNLLADEIVEEGKNEAE